jgi:hypothetical protein
MEVAAFSCISDMWRLDWRFTEDPNARGLKTFFRHRQTLDADGDAL